MVVPIEVYLQWTDALPHEMPFSVVFRGAGFNGVQMGQSAALYCRVSTADQTCGTSLLGSALRPRKNDRKRGCAEVRAEVGNSLEHLRSTSSSKNKRLTNDTRQALPRVRPLPCFAFSLLHRGCGRGRLTAPRMLLSLVSPENGTTCAVTMARMLPRGSMLWAAVAVWNETQSDGCL